MAAVMSELGHGEVIDLAIRNYLNIIIAGATGSGKQLA